MCFCCWSRPFADKIRPGAKADDAASSQTATNRFPCIAGGHPACSARSPRLLLGLARASCRASTDARLVGLQLRVSGRGSRGRGLLYCNARLSTRAERHCPTVRVSDSILRIVRSTCPASGQGRTGLVLGPPLSRSCPRNGLILAYSQKSSKCKWLTAR